MKKLKAQKAITQMNSAFAQIFLGRNSADMFNVVERFDVSQTKERGFPMDTLNRSTQDSEERNQITGDKLDYRLHLEMNEHSYARLTWLQGALRTTSKTEIVRRALDAYQVFDPEFSEDSTVASSNKAVGTRRFYVRISHEMKQHLDEEKSNFGRTYKETIRRALCVFYQLSRDRNRIIDQAREQLKGESNDQKDNSRMSDKTLSEHENAILLATI